MRIKLKKTIVYASLFMVFVILLIPATLLMGQMEMKQQSQQISQDRNETFILTNDAGMYFLGETGKRNSSNLQGLNVNTIKYLDDYIIEVNGKILQRNQSEATIYSDRIVRRYDDPELTEEITLMDSLPVLMIKLTSTNKCPITFTPVIPGEKASQNQATYWGEEDKLLFLTNRSGMVSNSSLSARLWTGVFIYPESDFINSDSENKRFYVGNTERDRFLPGKLTSFIDNPVYIFVIIGNDRDDILVNRKLTLERLKLFIRDPNKKIEGVRKT
ncbi:hypothetical protein JXB12_09885 [candidate division KSB1 bacterium]|nr:hypothetical protein [candidate division KSB1 bacterium]